MHPTWLRWDKRLQALAQDGLTYVQDDHDGGRYERLRVDVDGDSGRPLYRGARGHTQVARTQDGTGDRVRVVRLVSAYNRDRQGHTPIPHHVYRLVFMGEILDETPARGVGAGGAAFFGEHELPEPSLSRVIPPLR